MRTGKPRVWEYWHCEECDGYWAFLPAEFDEPEGYCPDCELLMEPCSQEEYEAACEHEEDRHA